MEERLKKLCACPAVSSREDALRRLIRQEIACCADSIQEDALGNLIVFKKGRKSTEKQILLDAHMDECGVMVSGFTDDGCLRFQLVGSVDRRTLIGKRVFLGEQGISGVIGMKPIHLSTREERKSVPKLKELYIDIGVKDKASAKALLSLGDVGFFSVTGENFGKNCWKGNGLDSKIPCAVLIQLLREELPVDCTFVFAAQEQVGTRGAFGAAFSQQPAIVLCLDGVAAQDTPLRKESLRCNQLGGGVVIPVSDRFTQYDRRLFELLRATAEENGVPWQIAAAEAGISDARAYQRSRRGVRTAGLAVAVRYLHAPTEIASLEDAAAMLDLTRAFLHVLAEEN